MKPESPAQEHSDPRRSDDRRDKPATVPPHLDDDKVELVSWDAPLVPATR